MEKQNRTSKMTMVVVRACAVTCVAAAYLKNRKQAIVQKKRRKERKICGRADPRFFCT